MKYLPLSVSFFTKPQTYLPFRKSLIIAATVICILLMGTLFNGCSTIPSETHETQVSTVPVSETYEKLLAIEGSEQYDPAVLEAFAQWIDAQDCFMDTYPEKWKLDQAGNIWLTCYTPLAEDHTRTVCNLVYDGESVYEVSTFKQQYSDVPKAVITRRVFTAKNSRNISDEFKSAFVDFILDSDWFPSKDIWNQCQSEWCFEMAPLPGSEDQTEYLTLLIKYWGSGSIPGDGGTMHSLYYDGATVQYWRKEFFILTTEVPEPTVPTVPEPTELREPFVKEESPAYQKLLTLYNAEDFLCNRFGYNELAIFAEWIDSLEGVTETYSGIWYLTHYGDDGAGLCCHTPLQEDNSCDYMEFFLWYGGMIITDPYTGRRYFTDIPREDISALIYGAYDPIGVDNWIRERMIEQALVDEHFTWNVMDPEFKILDSYYEIRRNWPYPEHEPDNYTDDIYLIFHVWRPGMDEDEYIKCYLSYYEELKRVFFGLDGADEYWLSGIIPNN